MEGSIGARGFLAAIWGQSPEGYVELHCERSDGKRFQWFYKWPTQLDEFLAKARTEDGLSHIWFGVGIRSRMRGRDEDVVAINALWCDVDFKHVPKEEAKKLVDGFPVRPSAMVATGGGIHLYWILREPTSDFALVRPILHGLATALKGDEAVCTLKQIMRVPGTRNIKPDYPSPKPVSSVRWLNPELTYNLSDFEFLPKPEPKKSRNPSECPVPLPEGATYVGGDGGRPGDDYAKKTKWDAILTPSGWTIAHERAGVTYWVRPGKTQGHSATTGFCGDLLYVFSENAPPFEQNTAYSKFAAYTLLNHGGDFAAAAKALAASGYGAGRGRPEGGHKQPNFELVKLIKFDSRPARYRVILKTKDGEELAVEVDNQTLLSFKLFMAAAYEQTNKILGAKQSVWVGMVAAIVPEVHAAPSEASPAGAFEMTLNEFIEDRKENADQGMLKAFPGYDDKEIYFRFSTFKATIKERGIRLEDSDVYRLLREHGWASSVKRFGDKTSRVWAKAYENGSAHLKPKKADAQMELPLPQGGSDDF